LKPYYEHAGITIYHGDCREVLPGLDVDVVVTDPPYGTGGWRRTEAGNGSDPRASLVRETWDDGATDWLAAVPTLTFWPPASVWRLLAAANGVGLVKHRALYMVKLDPKPQVGGRTAWAVEPIWCLSPAGFLLYGGVDWTSASTPREGRDTEATGHPYEKPLSVMRWLLSKTRAASAADPFMGSGTTLVAAKELGMGAVGIEIEERYCEIAARRLSQEVLALGIDSKPHRPSPEPTPAMIPIHPGVELRGTQPGPLYASIERRAWESDGAGGGVEVGAPANTPSRIDRSETPAGGTPPPTPRRPVEGQ
jgi:site-specific DNA-methyltransferase (adenine-specific)